MAMPQRLEAFRAIRMYPASPNCTPQLWEQGKGTGKAQPWSLLGSGDPRKTPRKSGIPAAPRPPRERVPNQVPNPHGFGQLPAENGGIMERVGLEWTLWIIIPALPWAKNSWGRP